MLSTISMAQFCFLQDKMMGAVAVVPRVLLHTALDHEECWSGALGCQECNVYLFDPFFFFFFFFQVGLFANEWSLEPQLGLFFSEG